MTPQDRKDKIARIAVDPRTRELNAQHQKLVNRLLSAMGEAMDTFIRRFLLRHFPQSVANRIEKFGTSAPEDCTGAINGLFEACKITRVEHATNREGDRQARVLAFVHDGIELARLEIDFKNGELSATEFVAKELSQYGLVFGYDVPAVRNFFWRLCQSSNPDLATASRTHYIMQFGVHPEPSLESIDYETTRPGLSIQDPPVGEQQRPADDRG